VVSLRPIQGDEFQRWLPKAVEDYAQQMLRDGGLSREEAWEKAHKDTEEVFPGGVPAPEQWVYVIERDGEQVGVLWIGHRADESAQELWIYDIAVGEQYRRQGIARHAMLFAEQEARRHGLSRVGLLVFGKNNAARSLYRSMGYEESAVRMYKQI
jgi:ribosomal protein S18 acetylase RimI-like enzyme